jgi:adenylate kinase family enzyme
MQRLEAAGSAVPDDVVANLVSTRLSQVRPLAQLFCYIHISDSSQDDVKHNGWVLVGLPSSPSQAAALSSAGVIPAATIHLNILGKR